MAGSTIVPYSMGDNTYLVQTRGGERCVLCEDGAWYSWFIGGALPEGAMEFADEVAAREHRDMLVTSA